MFLLATIGLYAGIGVMSRTSDAAEYYVAGRRVPALFNGMATGADWMSAASFIGMAGTLYLWASTASRSSSAGPAATAWSRCCSRRTCASSASSRFPTSSARATAATFRASSASCAAILCSFTYVVAQIYGVGLITTRLTGVPFELGVFLGLGGILVCSFLGGMRAVTWTQVAQYIILIIAYMIPVVWLSVKHTGIPVPQLVYGKVLEKVTATRSRTASRTRRKSRSATSSRQRAADAAAKLKDVDKSYAEARRRWRRPSPRRKPTTPRRTSLDAAKKALGGVSGGRRRGQGAVDQGGRRSRPRGAADTACRGVPGQATTPRATCRGATSWRWCSA